jgi:hypothetical protein
MKKYEVFALSANTITRIPYVMYGFKKPLQQIINSIKPLNNENYNNIAKDAIKYINGMLTYDDMLKLVNTNLSIIHCPLRYQGHFINRTLNNIKDYATTLEENKEDALNIQKTEFMLNLFQLGKDDSTADKSITKLVLFVNIRLDFVLDDNTNPDEIYRQAFNDDQSYIPIFKQFKTAMLNSLRYGHCLNPLKATDSIQVGEVAINFYDCTNSTQPTSGGYAYIIDVQKGGDQVWSCGLYEHQAPFVFFALLCFTISFKGAEKAIEKGLLPPSDLFFASMLLTCYVILQSIIALAGGIPLNMFGMHIGVFVVVFAMLYAVSKASIIVCNSNTVIIVSWLLAVWYSLITSWS